MFDLFVHIDYTKKYGILTLNFSLYFIELLLPKITKQPEWCLANVFYCSTYYFGKHTFNFCSTGFDELINSRLHYFVNFASCFFYDAWSYFSSLVNSSPASKCKVVPTQESPSLTIFSFPSTLSTFVPSFSVDLSLFLSCFW